MDAIEENKLIEELGSLEKDEEVGDSKELTSDELEERSIKLSDCLDESFSYLSGPILNKVRVSGVTRSIITRADGPGAARQSTDARNNKPLGSRANERLGQIQMSKRLGDQLFSIVGQFKTSRSAVRTKNAVHFFNRRFVCLQPFGVRLNHDHHASQVRWQMA